MVDPSAPKKRQRASRSQAKAAAGSVLPQPPEPVRLYVSLDGDDKLDGSSPRQRGKAGPFKTLDRAQREVRAIKRQNKGRLPAPVRVELAGGTYVLSKPWTLEPRDSGNPAETWWSKILAPAHDVTWAAAPGEQPIVSGGKRITGWKEGQVHGKRALVAPAPAVKRGSWFFRQLWVNGRRAQRTRLPEKGLYRIAELPDGVWEGEGHTPLFIGQDNFGYAEGDIQPWRNIQDVEFVALHYWIESRIPFESVDPSTRMARLQWKSRMRLSDDHSRGLAPYYIENVFEALAKPGQWYLDREAGKVYYLPRDGE